MRQRERYLRLTLLSMMTFLVWSNGVYAAFGSLPQSTSDPRPNVKFEPAYSVRILGNFSHIKHTREDAFGYSLKLWKEGDKIFGLLAAYVGAPADPPMGILEDVKFDPRTKRFSFTARLSTGLVHGKDDRWVYSRDRFSFDGVLNRTQVTGILTRSDVLSPQRKPESERIRWRRSKESTQDMLPPPATYNDWKVWADKILERLGPKW